MLVCLPKRAAMNVLFNVAYQPGMEKSELFLDFNVTVER